jgi:hypothetical protein
MCAGKARAGHSSQMKGPREKGAVSNSSAAHLCLCDGAGRVQGLHFCGRLLVWALWIRRLARQGLHFFLELSYLFNSAVLVGLILWFCDILFIASQDLNTYKDYGTLSHKRHLTSQSVPTWLDSILYGRVVHGCVTVNCHCPMVQ